VNVRDLTKLLRTELDFQLTDEADLRIQTKLDRELNPTEQSSDPRPVMTIREIACYLRVEPEVVGEMLGDIPCFELGGKLLFRREAVDAWLAKRERKLTYEILEFDVKHELLY